MPKYVVMVSYTLKYEKEITVYAPSDEEAADKACEIVMSWNNVDDAVAIDVNEDWG